MGSPVHKAGADRYSRDKVAADFERSGADWAVVLYDPWVYTDANWDPFRGIDRVLNWTPVDHYPIPLSMMPWLKGHGGIAMSAFGRDSMLQTAEANGGFPVFYAPHAIERVWHPRDRSTFRLAHDIPADAFLVGIVAANIGTAIYDRKNFSGMFHAMAAFMARRPDAYLYIHSNKLGWEGARLPDVVRHMGLDEKRIRWVDQYAYAEGGISDDDMADAYSAMDVLLATSRGEGFGLPVLEAQACGTPVIVSNWTAQAELVGDGPWTPATSRAAKHPSGWLVSVQPEMDFKHYGNFAFPSIHETVAALDDAHDSASTMREAAVAKAASWDADAVFEEHWRPILRAMESAMGKETRQQRRAKKRRAA